MKEPDIVAYLYTNKSYPDMKGVSLHHDPSCTNTETEMEPLITLKNHNDIVSDLLERIEGLESIILDSIYGT